jgi:hypothetical protein
MVQQRRGGRTLPSFSPPWFGSVGRRLPRCRRTCPGALVSTSCLPAGWRPGCRPGDGRPLAPRTELDASSVLLHGLAWQPPDGLPVPLLGLTFKAATSLQLGPLLSELVDQHGAFIVEAYGPEPSGPAALSDFWPPSADCGAALGELPQGAVLAPHRARGRGLPCHHRSGCTGPTARLHAAAHYTCGSPITGAVLGAVAPVLGLLCRALASRGDGGGDGAGGWGAGFCLSVPPPLARTVVYP